MDRDHTQAKVDEMMLRLKNVFSWWKSFVKDKNAEQLVLDDNWSIKDVLAHLYMWQLVSRARLKAAIADTEPVVNGWLGKIEPESKEELDRVNEWMYKENKDKPWEEIWQLWESGFKDLLLLCDKVPVECWFDREKYEWLHGFELFAVLEGTLEHHEEHQHSLAMFLKIEAPSVPSKLG